MIQNAHLHQSVYIWNNHNTIAAGEWCIRVIGPGRRQDYQHFDYPGLMWNCSCVESVSPHSVITECYVFTFINPAHKMLFDIAWGHLGIYDSVALLQADQHCAY